MHGLLTKLFAKRGIKDVTELDNEEKTVFEAWDKILSKEQLSVEDIKQFCQTQLDIIETRWRDFNTDNAKKGELVPYHTVYKTLLTVIDSPLSSRESLENYLNQLLLTK